MAGHSQRKPMQTPAERKAHKSKYRQSHGAPAATIAGTSVPLLVPGTTTRHEQLQQARRFLSNELRANPPRFTKPAIQEVEKLFHKNDDIRVAHRHHTMSAEAVSIVAVLEAERALATDGSDWWGGPIRKGVTKSEQKEYKAAYQMAKAIHKGELDTIGLDVEGEEVEDEALGAISLEGVDFAGWTFDHVGYEDSDDSVGGGGGGEGEGGGGRGDGHDGGVGGGDHHQQGVVGVWG
ncbi:MAG: hypothetical protein Q9176_004078 [Flavoplaca citrina]